MTRYVPLLALFCTGCVRFDLILRNSSDSYGARAFTIERAEVWSEKDGCLEEDILGGTVPPGEVWTGERIKAPAGPGHLISLCIFTTEGPFLPRFGQGALNGCTLDFEIWYSSDPDPIPGEEFKTDEESYDCPGRPPSLDFDDLPPPVFP